MPEPMSCMASVATNDGIFSRETAMPLMQPNTVPMASTIRIVSGTHSGLPASGESTIR